jgi:Zn finger protein HypA/HybF involved in hydrogenase expression
MNPTRTEVGRKVGIAAFCVCPECGGEAYSIPKDDFYCRDCSHVITIAEAIRIEDGEVRSDISSPAYHIRECPSCREEFFLKCPEVSPDCKTLSEIPMTVPGVRYMSPDQKIAIYCRHKDVKWQISGLDLRCPYCNDQFHLVLGRVTQDLGSGGIVDWYIQLYK